MEEALKIFKALSDETRLKRVMQIKLRYDENEV